MLPTEEDHLVGREGIDLLWLLPARGAELICARPFPTQGSSANLRAMAKLLLLLVKRSVARSQGRKMQPLRAGE